MAGAGRDGVRVGGGGSRWPCDLSSPGIEAGFGESVSGTEVSSRLATALPQVKHAPPIPFLGKIASFGFRHENALLSGACYQRPQGEFAERIRHFGQDGFGRTDTTRRAGRELSYNCRYRSG